MAKAPITRKESPLILMNLSNDKFMIPSLSNSQLSSLFNNQKQVRMPLINNKELKIAPQSAPKFQDSIRALLQKTVLAPRTKKKLELLTIYLLYSIVPKIDIQGPKLQKINNQQNI